MHNFAPFLGLQYMQGLQTAESTAFNNFFPHQSRAEQMQEAKTIAYCE